MMEFRDELRDELRTAMDGLRNWEAFVDSQRARVAGLVNTLHEIEATLGIDSEADNPKGSEAVRIVAMEAIEDGWEHGEDNALTVTQIVEELERRGWQPNSRNPESAVRAAIRRLRQADPKWALYNSRLYYDTVPDEEEEPF